MVGRSFSLANTFEARAQSMTSIGYDTPRAWPFITNFHFEALGETTRLETRSEILLYAPLLQEQTEKDAWANYSVENEAWLEQSYERAIKTLGSESYADVVITDQHIIETVYRLEDDQWIFEPESDATMSWLPVWQISPPPLEPYPINFNLLSIPAMRPLVDQVRVNKVPVMSDRLARHSFFTHLAAQYDTITPPHNHEAHGYDNVTDHEGHGHRHRKLEHGATSNEQNDDGLVFVVYPIFDSLEDDEDRNLVGVFLALIRWDWMLTDALHTGTEPVTAVLNNT